MLVGITTMTQVWLHSNIYFGEIPTRFSNIEGLQELLLSNNQLTTSMLEGLTSLGKLVTFSIDFNFLDGNLPAMGKGGLLHIMVINFSAIILTRIVL